MKTQVALHQLFMMRIIRCPPHHEKDRPPRSPLCHILLQAMSRPDFMPPVFHLNPVKIELAPGHSKILELEGIVENPQIVRC